MYCRLVYNAINNNKKGVKKMVVELNTGLTGKQAGVFKRWFDKNIGTEYDYEEDWNGLRHFVLFDLEDEELEMVRDWENQLSN